LNQCIYSITPFTRRCNSCIRRWLDDVILFPRQTRRRRSLLL